MTDVSDEVKEGYGLLEGIGIVGVQNRDSIHREGAIIYAVLCKQMLGADADDFKSEESQQVI